MSRQTPVISQRPASTARSTARSLWLIVVSI
jgi:hypothetical protein